MREWAKAKIGEVSLGIYDGPHATPAPCETPGPYFLGIPQISPLGFIDMASPRYIAERDYGAWTKRVVPQYGDVVFSYEATLNLYALIPRDFKCCLGRRMGLVRPNPKKLDFQFLYYYFFSPEWRGTVRENTITGATVDRLSIAAFPNFEIALPPLPIQRRIAAILSDYDSAIDNARRQIALLEEAAMRLYREWFGDGKGERKPLGEFIEITTSGSWGTDTKTVKTPNEVICIRGADFEEIHGRSLGKQIRRFISDKHLVERSLKDGDLVVEMSGGSPTQSTGRVVSISDMFLARYGVPVLATNFCKVIRPKSGYSHFLYLAWRDLYVSRIMFNYEVGTTGIKNFDYDLFVSDVEVSNPLPKLTQFNGLVDGMFSSMDMLGSLVQDLTEARDRLLPKLMSGEIEV